MGRKELEALDWGRIYPRVVDYARTKLRSRRSEHDAEDFAQEALRRLFEHKATELDPNDAEQGVLFALGSIINGLLRNDWRDGTRRAQLRDTPSYQAAGPAAPPGPEDRLADKVRLARAWALLVGRIEASDEDDTYELLLATVEEKHAPVEQQHHLGWPMKKVYRVRHVYRAHCDAVLKQVQREEQ